MSLSARQLEDALQLTHTDITLTQAMKHLSDMKQTTHQQDLLAEAESRRQNQSFALLVAATALAAVAIIYLLNHQPGTLPQHRTATTQQQH